MPAPHQEQSQEYTPRETKVPFYRTYPLPPPGNTPPVLAPYSPSRMLAQPGGFSSPFALALATQLQGGGLQSHFASLHHHLSTLAQQSQSSSASHSTASTPCIPVRKPRMGGTTVKTAKVWKYFDQLPSEEQAAECQLCRKKIKATNSSTTGMIRHLRSCHVVEYQQLQEARQSCMLVKIADGDEKARAQFVKEFQSTTPISTPLPKPRSPQLSPHSASDSAISDSSSSPLTIMSILRGLPAPKPLLPLQPVKMEVDTEEEGPTEVAQDLTTRPSAPVPCLPRKSVADTLEERRINTQIALMILLDSCSSTIVDKPGFRGLMKMILPSHSLPPASHFDSIIIPDVIARLKADLASPFATTARSDSHEETKPPVEAPSGVEQVMAAMKAATNISRSFSHSLELRREEDSDSTSSADSETAMPARIDSFLNFVGRYVFPHEELITVLTLCRAWFAHFEEGGDRLLVGGLSFPPRLPGRPDLARDVAFVAENVDRLNVLVCMHPEIDLPRISDAQAQFIRDLDAHIAAV